MSAKEDLNSISGMARDLDTSKISNPAIRAAAKRVSGHSNRGHYDAYGDDIGYGSDHADYCDSTGSEEAGYSDSYAEYGTDGHSDHNDHTDSVKK